MDQSRDVWVGDGSGVEDAEEGTILCCGMCAWRRQQLLEASAIGRDLAGVMRVVEVHEGPDLRSY